MYVIRVIGTIIIAIMALRPIVVIIIVIIGSHYA
jgi:hypothetical protein